MNERECRYFRETGRPGVKESIARWGPSFSHGGPQVNRGSGAGSQVRPCPRPCNSVRDIIDGRMPCAGNVAGGPRLLREMGVNRRHVSTYMSSTEKYFSLISNEPEDSNRSQLEF